MVYLLIFAAACALSLSANWSIRGLARQIGLVDRPDGFRKLQKQAVPVCGGIAIFLTILVGIGTVVAIVPGWRETVLLHLSEVLGLLIASTLIVVVGILDDSIGLRGRQKLLGQIAAAIVVVYFGNCITRVRFMGFSPELGIMAAPFTVFWLLGAMNSLNLLDGIDGLAATIGLVLSAAIGVLALMTGHESIALMSFVLSGGIAGFLVFNFPPASMYLGDAGSMLIGLLVGVLAIKASLTGPGTTLLAAPLALCTIPIFDSAAAVLRRTLTGRSIYTTDRAHFHHHLLQRLGHRQTLVCVAGLSMLTSAAALLSVWWRQDQIAIVCAAVVVSMFIVFRVFGHTELKLLLIRTRALLRSLFSLKHPGRAVGWEDAVRMQGTRQWELLWETLTEWAVRLELVQVRLDVNLPILGEGYHATWNRMAKGRDDRYWRLQLPLIADQKVVGFVMVTGERVGAGERTLEHLQDLVEQIEAHLQSIATGEITELVPPRTMLGDESEREQVALELER